MNVCHELLLNVVYVIYNWTSLTNKQYHVEFNREVPKKCSFFMPKVRYVGHVDHNFLSENSGVRFQKFQCTFCIYIYIIFDLRTET
jgi:hypothetical protein